MSKLAVVLIRGLVGVRHDIKQTLAYLNLHKKHACVIIEDTPVTRGMIKKIESYVTYGQVSEETIKALDEKRKGNDKHVYFLAPPVGGFERKGIKHSFNNGGALGNRNEAINELLAKMM